jgi:hypothetical protein
MESSTTGHRSVMVGCNDADAFRPSILRGGWGRIGRRAGQGWVGLAAWVAHSVAGGRAGPNIQALRSRFELGYSCVIDRLYLLCINIGTIVLIIVDFHSLLSIIVNF